MCIRDSIGGKPNVGLAFRLVAAGPSIDRSQAFECRVDVAKSSPGVTEVQIMGTALGTWEDAFGVDGFDLLSPRLLLEVDTAQRVGFGVRGGLRLGSKEMALAAKLQLHAVTGVPVGGFFEGSHSSSRNVRTVIRSGWTNVPSWIVDSNFSRASAAWAWVANPPLLICWRKPSAPVTYA